MCFIKNSWRNQRHTTPVAKEAVKYDLQTLASALVLGLFSGGQSFRNHINILIGIIFEKQNNGSIAGIGRQLLNQLKKRHCLVGNIFIGAFYQ